MPLQLFSNRLCGSSLIEILISFSLKVWNSSQLTLAFLHPISTSKSFRAETFVWAQRIDTFSISAHVSILVAFINICFGAIEEAERDFYYFWPDMQKNLFLIYRNIERQSNEILYDNNTSLPLSSRVWCTNVHIAKPPTRHIVAHSMSF